MKLQADRHQSDISFEKGDLVYVKLQPYRQHSVALRKSQKLGLRYFGPFPVLDTVGKVAYKLGLPDSAKIHPVFHVSLLKPCSGQPTSVYLPTLDLEDKVILDGVDNVTDPSSSSSGPTNTKPNTETMAQSDKNLVAARRGLRARKPSQRMRDSLGI